MNIDRVRVVWSGDAVVGGGVSTLYAAEGDGHTLASGLASFFNNIKQFFPSSKVHWAFNNVGETIDASTGQAVGAWTGDGVWSETSTGSEPSWASGVGVRVQWNTNVFSNGRRVRGSTFLVPLAVSAYDTDGSLSSTVTSTVQAQINALITAAPSLGVHSRPSPGGSDGGFATVSSGLCVDKVSWLRSRKI